MYNDFIVKVFRYWEEENGSRGWDGWYFSKVYAIDGNEFLVYDNGDMSAYNGEEDFCETGFNWVDFTATMDRCGESGRQPMVEPLVPFDIVEFMADLKTEPSNSEIPNNSTISKMEQVDEPRKEQNFCGKCRYLYRDFKYGLSCYRLMDDEPCKFEYRKAENSSEIPNNSTTEDCSTVPTISKMEQVEDEPQTECKNCREGQEHDCYGCPFVKQVEPQTDCAWK